MAIVAVGKTLRDKLGEDGVNELVELINSAHTDQRNEILTFVEEKFERHLSEEFAKLETKISNTKAALENRMSEIEAGLKSQISENKAGFESQISETKGALESKISETKAELIKWMFIFWVGQVGVLIGILLAFFK